jgi:hypothetical protein
VTTGQRLTREELSGMLGRVVRALPAGTLPPGRMLALDYVSAVGYTVREVTPGGSGGQGSPFGEQRLSLREMYWALLVAARALEMVAPTVPDVP